MQNKTIVRQLKKEAKAVGLTLEEYTEILISENEAQPTIGQMLNTISHINYQLA